MSIGVQSFPELYTMLMGWDLYDKLWNLLTQTGIAYLPFIGMVLRNVTQSYISHHDTKNGVKSPHNPFLLANIFEFFNDGLWGDLAPLPDPAPFANP